VEIRLTRYSSSGPVIDWKRHPYFDGSLPAADPAHDLDHPDAPSMPEF
jgi:hypothetical protein